MNVTMVSGSPDIQCGVGTYTVKLLTSLSTLSSGIRFSYLAPFGTRPTQLPDVIDYVTVPPGKVFRDFVRQTKPGLLHVQFPSATREFFYYRTDLLLCRLLTGSRYLITAHEVITPKWTLAGLGASGILSIRGQRAAFCVRGLSRLKKIIPLSNPPMLPRCVLSDDMRLHVRSRLGVQEGKKLVSFLGFLTSAVEIKWMLSYCNPQEHELVVMGKIPSIIERNEDEYHQLCREFKWDYDKLFKGFVPEHDAAEILAASDIVFLPFRQGCQESINTSYLAARLQGSYIVTTSANRCGYDSMLNTFFVRLDQIEKMKEALAFAPRPDGPASPGLMTWEGIARLHIDIYSQMLRKH